MKYNKLVRDNIPEIIEKNGSIPVTRTLDDAEFMEYLEKKLDEEVAEFHESKTIEELADILEVVFALNKVCGMELFAKWHEKRDARGGFDERILLIETIDSQEDGAE